MSYDAFAATFSESRKNLRWGEIGYFVEFMRKNSTNGEISILDVGCGNGRFLETLEESGLSYSYLGIDESSGMIDEARKLHPDNIFRVLDMKNLLGLADLVKYDYIIFIASFHHLHNEWDRKEVLDHAKRFLKKWGFIMMTNWNLLGETLFPKYEKSHRWNGDFDIKIGAHNRYYHGFTETELASLFERSGYEVLENRPFEEGKNIVSVIRPIG